MRSPPSGKLSFTRWEPVNGKFAAVFTFALDKKKSHYIVDYCCFPATESISAMVTPTGDAVMLPSPGMLRKDSWRPFKKSVPYHGSFYIDSDTGAIVRTVTIAELKPYDSVHAEKVRIDYSLENISGKSCAVPVREVMWNEIVPGASTRQPNYPIRREVLTADYANYAGH